LINYVKSKAPNAKIITTGSFWASSTKDTAIQTAATASGLPFVKLSQLDIPMNRSSMGAQVFGDDGQWHTVNNSGVAAHPGDIGMSAIANEIYNSLGL